MKHEEAINILKQLSADDITPGMEVVGPHGEWPLHGFYWKLKNYDTILDISGVNGKVASIIYWRSSDFGISKIHIQESKIELNSITFDKQNKLVQIKKLSGE